MVKGAIQTLEAAIAVSIILASVMFMQSTHTVEEDYLDQLDVCMEYLYKSGLIREDVVVIQEELLNCLPVLTEFTIKKCDTVDCTTALPGEKIVSSSSYVIAGPEILNAWVWEK